jgi:hypothetical protein
VSYLIHLISKCIRLQLATFDAPEQLQQSNNLVHVVFMCLIYAPHLRYGSIALTNTMAQWWFGDAVFDDTAENIER